jgi:CHAT domain-containing protein
MGKKQPKTLANRAKFLGLVLIGTMLVFSLNLLGSLSLAVLPPASLSATSIGMNAVQTDIPRAKNHRTLKSATADAQNWLDQGKTYYQNGQFAEALDSWLQVKRIYQERGDRLNEAFILSYLALAHQQLGQWEAADTAIATSLNLLQTHSGDRTTPTYQTILAHVWNTEGNGKFARGQAEQALTSWQMAATAYATAGEDEQYIGSLMNQAQAQQALGFFLQAHRTFAEIEKRLHQQPDVQTQMTELRSLGNLLRLTGDLDESERVLQESLAIARSLNSSQDISLGLLSLGNTKYAQQNLPEASELYQQAAAYATLPLTTVQAQLNQLAVLVQQTQWTTANALASQIQLKLTTLSPSRPTIYAYINFAQSLRTLNTSTSDPQLLRTAAQVLATAVEMAQNLNDIQAQAYALGHLGGVYEKTQQWAIARTLTEQGLSLAQSINALDISYQWQWQLGRIFKQQGQKQDAIAAYQTAYDALQTLRRDLVAIDTSIQFSFKESVEPVYRQYVDLLLQPDNKRPPSQDNLAQARNVMEALQLAELTNFFRSACLEGQLVALDQVDQDDAAVIYPIILSDRLEVIVSLPQQPLKHYSTPVSQGQVDNVLQQFRLQLERPFTAPEGRRLGKQVYDWMLRPLESDLAQHPVNVLVFVLDGQLRNVPMSALFDGNQYVVEHYAVAIAPGLQLINPQPLLGNNVSALVAGLTEERYGFPPLRNVETEVQEITAEVPNSRILLNQSFTSTALQEQIERLPFPIVHLATHGQFSSSAADTFVLAWDKRILIDELSDLLRTSDETRPRAVELLVLSACETAEGDSRAALGLAGIAVRAGARSTLASLWSVDDESGARLISEFYRQLSTSNFNRAEALRQAQLSLLQNPDYRHPSQWSPYVLVGNWL